MDRAPLIEMARHNLKHTKAGTIEQEAEVFRVPASNYFDGARFKIEVDQVFKRVPLVLAPTAELPNPGDYKAMEVTGLPILLSRGQDGKINAFINSCVHRGAQIMLEGTGNTRRFTCPYHGWTFSQDGKLVGIASREDFGEVDASCNSLTRLPALEKAGLIWVVLNPNSGVNIEAFLSGYDALLANFGLDSWHLFSKRTIRGPNWKIAYDGYLDLYHLPVLHKDTFGPQMSNRALYYAWGPHQRVTSPTQQYVELENAPTDQWPSDLLMAGVWTIFPHISIASFYGGGRSIMLSQLFPGAHPGESFTTQYYLMEKAPTEAQAKEAEEQFKLLEYVVREEDYATGLRQQRALESGARSHVLFGRNEGGGRRFHGWVERIIAANDQELNRLFSSTPTRTAAE